MFLHCGGSRTGSDAASGGDHANDVNVDADNNVKGEAFIGGATA